MSEKGKKNATFKTCKNIDKFFLTAVLISSLAVSFNGINVCTLYNSSQYLQVIFGNFFAEFKDHFYKFLMV